MSRESKILQAGIWSVEKTVYHYECFGWELLSLNGNQITMSRETQNPVYIDLVKNQAKYEQLVQEYKSLQAPSKPQEPPKFLFGRCCLLLVLGIVPGVLYIRYKINQKKAYKEALARFDNSIEELKNKKEETIAKIDQLLTDSRATFFAKQ